MKKLFAWVLVLSLLLSGVSVLAEAAETVEEQDTSSSESEFERVLLKKGSLIIKEFIDYGKVEDMTFQSASILDVETGEKVYALRITTSYYSSKYDYGDAVGVMDADEIDGAISTLEYIKAHVKELKDYSEIEYTASSGMEVGAYHSSTSSKVYIKVNNKATNFYDLNKIDTLITAFKGVKKTFGE